jgi:NADH-quinone oxidoreductase subunit N
MIMQDSLIFMPEVLLTLFSLCSLAGISFWPQKMAQVIHSFFKIILILCVVCYFWPPEVHGEHSLFSGMFVQNTFTLTIKVFMVILALGVYVAIEPFLDVHQLNQSEFPILMAFSLVGYMLMVSSDHFISLFLSMELASFSTYLLVAFNRDSPMALESALKYFILGSFSTALFLFGLSFIYGVAGSLSFSVLGPLLSSQQETNLYMTLGILSILAMGAFKLSLAPFHIWTLDVYEGTPTPVVTYLSALPKVAAMGIFLRIMMELFHGQKDLWQPALSVLVFLSMSVGSFTALFQKNIKRMMAYSTITHMGYALLGLMVADFQGAASLLVYMTLYSFMTLGVFTCLLMGQHQGRYFEVLDDLKGLGASSPLLAGAFMVFLFSLAGIPPLSGFFAKMTIFSAALERGYTALVIVGVLTSVVSAGFYLRLVRIMYFDKDVKEVEDTPLRLDRVMKKPTLWIMIFSLLITLLYIVQPQLLPKGAYRAVKSIFIKL